MTFSKVSTRVLWKAALVTIFAVTAAYAQTAEENATPTAADHDAARTAKSRYHAPAIFRVENRKYAAQLEYSNAEHGCIGEP
jgi:hypothetical protein